ncbi:hypothetical protein GOBAR_AA33326 [Gossypium barbadense]|uniref:Uncharacterized protein n=1 Tax=Gossypium barbadense TaxID=3634 RepID=A0A2P5W8E7_GOSBA|nr:hypothetical protein GOBAR_AA33326 [Gossypium barbadense]
MDPSTSSKHLALGILYTTPEQEECNLHLYATSELALTRSMVKGCKRAVRKTHRTTPGTASTDRPPM